jgi:hypothetical protein
MRADGGIKETGCQEDWYNVGTNISTELLNYTESHLGRQLHSSFCENLKYKLPHLQSANILHTTLYMTTVKDLQRKTIIPDRQNNIGYIT